MSTQTDPRAANAAPANTTIVPTETVASTRRVGPGSHAARAVLRFLARRVRRGTLVVTDGSREWRTGRGEPTARVVVHDQRTYSELLRRGSVGLGASYLDGWWDCDDLTALVRILEWALDPVLSRADRFARRTSWAAHLRSRPARDGKGTDRRNIHAHFDLGNDFYELLLDETMGYSCAVFDPPSATLTEASNTKFDRLCRKLDLRPDDHVVEIGTGWGHFAVFAAQRYGCRVTTTTNSEAHYEYATKRVADAGLTDLVTIRNDDYRDLTGTYDKLVCIEMIETFGWRQLDTFFTVVGRLLRPDGLMGLQAIVIADQSYERTKRGDEFIGHYIFPGGCLPSIGAIVGSTARTTDLRVIDLEDIGWHYAETLARWRANLEQQAPAISELGLPDTLHRLFELYLSYCEAGFLNRRVSDVQMILARRDWTPPLAVRAL